MCLFRYHHFVHVNPLKLFHRPTLCMWHHFFLSVFLGPPPDLRVSILSCLICSSPPQSRNRTSPILSPSFVALVKSLAGIGLLPLSLLLFPCLAAVPACVLCVCFACVSMSNDSIPHWPMHGDSPIVV